VELERLTDYSDVAAAHLRYRAALARADVARAILGDVLRRNETEIRNSRNVSSVARGIGVSREFLHRVLNRAEWTWKKVSQAVEPTVRMEGLVTDRQAAVEGSEWIITVTFAVEATGEREARKIVSDVLSHMDMTSDGNPSAERGGDEPWAIEVKLNLSAVPVIEPDDARTRISYVTRNLEGVTWRVIQANEDDALFEWPPHRQASSEWKEVLGNPAIRAATVRASLHVT
jgi:DNA-binding phage protein